MPLPSPTAFTRCRRGSPPLMVADASEKRHHTPRRMTAPEASQRAIQWVPHLSLAAPADPRELVSGMPGILPLSDGEERQGGAGRGAGRVAGVLRAPGPEQTAARARNAGRTDRMMPGISGDVPATGDGGEWRGGFLTGGRRGPAGEDRPDGARASGPGWRRCRPRTGQARGPWGHGGTGTDPGGPAEGWMPDSRAPGG